MAERIKTFLEFYNYYLNEHRQTGTRIVHFISTIIILVVLAYVVFSGKDRFLWYIPIMGYGLPLLSHFIFERNRPTFWSYPLWTLAADFTFFFELITTKAKFKA